MKPTVRALWRHPIKGHGREALDQVELLQGQTMPWDRRWAVTHEASQTYGRDWARCANFTRAAKVPAIMAIEAASDEGAGIVTLTHPDLTPLVFDPDTETQAFLDWVRPLMPPERAQSTGLVRVEGRGMTDSDYPSVSLINLASHRQVETRIGTAMSTERWRCNIHVEGLEAWSEFDLVGGQIALGDVQFDVIEPIERCMATHANPATGKRDLDTLGTLNGEFGHQNFGINLRVTQSGTLSVGDTLSVL